MMTVSSRRGFGARGIGWGLSVALLAACSNDERDRPVDVETPSALPAAGSTAEPPAPAPAPAPSAAGGSTASPAPIPVPEAPPAALPIDETPPPGGASGEAPTAPAAERWVGAWATGPQLTEPNNNPPAPGLANNTLRQNVFPTLSGSRVRVHFSNEFGNGPVTLDAANLAATAGASNLVAGSARPLSFGGNASATIQQGQTLISDPIEQNVTALESLAISVRFGAVPSNITGHPGSRTTSFLQTGDAASAETMNPTSSTEHWYFITGVDVDRPEPSAAIVTLGDSITDGRGSTTNGNDRWPDGLARRLQADPATSHISVLNQGIGGGAVVNGGLGPTAIQRFERDVLNQRNVRWVIVLEGVNDIGGAQDASVANRLIDAYDDFIDQAHARGLSIYGVPILPFAGSGYDSPAHQEARRVVNEWIRTSGRYDAVIDLDAAVADPADPNRLRSEYDTGDRLHLNPNGYKAMADAIDLTLFQP